MPRYVVSGTKREVSGFHDITLEADSEEEACRLATEKHGLFTVVSADVHNRPILEAMETSVPDTGRIHVRSDEHNQALMSAQSATGCLWATVILIAFVTVLGAAVALVGLNSFTLAAGFALLGLAAVAIPRGFIAVIELLAVLVRQNPK